MKSYPTPETIIKTEILGPHFTKHHIGHGLAIHHITEAADFYFHDHPWGFSSSVLSGGYMEEVAEIDESGRVTITTYKRSGGTTHHVKSGAIHRLVRLLDGDCWTLVKAGEKDRAWGFYRFEADGVYFRYEDGEWTKLY